jgi:hypothetical protein
VRYRRNAAEAKLCEHAKFLAQYLNIDVDPYDFGYMLEEFVAGKAHDEDTDPRPRHMRKPSRPAHPELAGIEGVEELTDEQRAEFTRYVTTQVPYLMSSDPLGVPAYLYFEKARTLPPGTWLVHFSRDSFLSFKKGATLETLALSTHTDAKTLKSCEANLDPDAGIFETVWGFALEADGLSHRTLRGMKHYGEQVMLFQTDCAVSAWHTTDNFEQVIFPLCSEYNVHRGSYDGHVLSFESTEDDGEYKEFETLDEVIADAEAGKLVPNAPPEGARRETFPEQMARMRAERDAFVAKVERAVTVEGGFVAQHRGGTDLWVTLTRSTRPGVAWQVTFWDGHPAGARPVPTGHIDVTGGLADAARELIGLVVRA